jgi:3-phenylpropionate/cinnamic acid dioxygenase small subunit
VDGIASYSQMGRNELRLELEDLYANYAACLNEERFEDWPGFFVDKCLYKIVPRENHVRGLPLATMLCESKGYLLDRVQAIRRTQVFAPRVIRRLVSGIRPLGWQGEELECRAEYAAFETMNDELTRVFNVGRYLDRIVVEDGRLKFKEKICVFDTNLVPNSLIYPL